jgi:hypothetical protein
MASREPFPNHDYRKEDFVPRDLDAERDLSQDPPRGSSKQAEFYSESPPIAPPLHAAARYARPGQRPGTLPKVSRGKRVFRGVARFSVAIIMGVCLTLGWQSYGEKAELIVRGWAPSVAWLIPAQSTQPTDLTAVTVRDLALQLKPLSSDLAIVRRGVEQLAANQDRIVATQQQMAQSINTMQQAEQEIADAVHLSRRSPLGVH